MQLLLTRSTAEEVPCSKPLCSDRRLSTLACRRSSFAFVLADSRLSPIAVVPLVAMASALTSISIIVAGEHTPQGKALFDIANEYRTGYESVDVRKWLGKDPSRSKAYKISHYQNSDFLPCQLALSRYGDAFVTCVSDVASNIAMKRRNGVRKMWILYCSAGQHRSDGVAKCAASRISNYVRRQAVLQLQRLLVELL